jgi:predicted amidohydrolase
LNCRKIGSQLPRHGFALACRRGTRMARTAGATRPALPRRERDSVECRELAESYRAWGAVRPVLGDELLCKEGFVNLFRIALANVRFPSTPDESIQIAIDAIDQARSKGAQIVCFPECFVPGYREVGKSPPPADPLFLERAWSAIADATAKASITVVLGTERFVDGNLVASAIVIDQYGTATGFQDKVQIDPSEENTYKPGAGRQVFQAGPVTFGIAICHEGWRYPETVRWAARRGAHIVFHPHFHPAEPGAYRPTTFADPANSFHEKAALCRAAENTCYFATVNYATPGSPTTSAVIRPDGTLLSYQPYGVEGVLVADIDIAQATGLLASRCRY